MTYLEIEREAISLGARIEGGMNWTWAIGFTPKKAERFIALLESAGRDHRGIYPNINDSLRDVRFR